MLVVLKTSTLDPEGDDPLATGLDPAVVIPARIAHWADVEPDRTFMTEVDATGRSVTYGEFHDELLRWCAYLRALGVGPSARVAAFLPQSIDAQLVWLAASCVGAYEVAVNPELRGEMLRHVLADSKASVCFVRPEHADVPASAGLDVEVVVVPRGGGFVSGFDPVPLDRFPGPSDVCCVLYTSGTTGPAKGAVIPWGHLSAILGRTPRSWFAPDDAVYTPLPMFHVTGRTPTLTMADVGGRVVLRERVSITEFWSDIRVHGCTSTTVTSAPLLLAAPPSADDTRHPLRFGLFGPLGPVVVEFGRRFNVRCIANYGSTEIGFPFTNRRVALDTCHLAGWLRPGYEAMVIGPEGDDLGSGEIGELLIKPPHPLLMMQGYLGDPALTDKVVVDGWYHTGDAVILHEDGSLQFVDRLRDTLRRFGENISSAALESVINTDPAVLECAVLGVPSQVAGHEVLVLVRTSEGASFDAENLYRRLIDQLPRHCLPAFIMSYHDEFPKTPNGKIRKVALKGEIEQAAAGGAWMSPSAVSRHRRAPSG
jgi:carnitine-CoA ligase